MLEFLRQMSRYIPKDIPRKVGPYIVLRRDSKPGETTVACEVTEIKLSK